MMVCGSINDDRVPYWGPLKWVAKMRNELKDMENPTENPTDEDSQKDTSSSPLLLCTIDKDGGHFGSTSSQTVEEVILSLLI
jgi:hypothetical protein